MMLIATTTLATITTVAGNVAQMYTMMVTTHNVNDLSNIINKDNITAAWTRLTFSTAAAAVAAMPSSCSDDTAQR